MKINTKVIEEAHKRIKKHIFSTPMITNEKINKKFESRIFFKLECNQLTGSFKIRGALNKIMQLNTKERQNGVVAYSSGNHAQAVSYASKLLNVDSIIVMPKDAPKIKLDNTKKFGAKVVLYDRMNESREDIALDIVKKNGGILIKPFDDADIIIGQGTIGYEIAKDLIDKKIKPDILLCCCSGGGLIAGVSTYLKSFFENLLIYCVEPEYYDDMRLSLEKGKLLSISTNYQTLCDALTVKIAGEITFQINKKLLKGGLVVSDDEVKKAIRFLKNKLNIIAEPGGAASTAALIANRNIFRGKTIVVIVSGGNIDNQLFQKIMNES